jgi:site-specific DNA-methyltransferase (adenine-specific)
MGTNTAASWWEGRKSGVRPPGLAVYARLKELLGMDGRYDELIEWLEAEREVLSIERRYNEPSGIVGIGQGDRTLIDRKITAPATAAAQQWQGWGTALKPAFEPVVMGRKPLIGTVAQNAQAHGVGALNIDDCRNGGRWPANVVLDEGAAATFPESRFMYAAKAPKKERPVVDGIAHPTVKPLALMRWLVKLVTPAGGTVLEPFAGSGATVEACLLEGFHCIAIEREAEYLPLIQQRIERAA